MKKVWFIPILLALLAMACTIPATIELPDVDLNKPIGDVLGAQAETEGVPAIGNESAAEATSTAGISQEDLDANATAQADLVQPTPRVEVQGTVGPIEPYPAPGEPTPEPPDVTIGVGETKVVPAGFTLQGDVKVCPAEDSLPDVCVQLYDTDVPETGLAVHFTEPTWVYAEWGASATWTVGLDVAEKRLLDHGCGLDDGCTSVQKITWPDDAEDLGYEAFVAEVPEKEAEAEPSATPELQTTPEPDEVAGSVVPGAWMLPSWIEVVTETVSGPQALDVQFDVQSMMVPEALPLVPPDALTYQTPPENCVARNTATDSCTTDRRMFWTANNVPIELGELLRMTGDAISIKWAGTNNLLAERPDGKELHDLWMVLNLSSEDVLVDITAPYGSDRSWYTATTAWMPELLDELMRQAVQDFNLQLRDPSEFSATPVPNCESSAGCSYSNVRAVIILDDQVLVYTAKWFEEQEPHWEAFVPTSYTR